MSRRRYTAIRLVIILFPGLEKLVPVLHMVSVYAILSEFPGAKQIAAAHLMHFKSVLAEMSKDRYDREKTVKIRNAARASIGSDIPAKSLKRGYTIRLIRELDREIKEVEEQILAILDTMQPPITTIPDMGKRMG